MIHTFQSIRGVHDYLPNDMGIWQYIEDNFKKILKNYCYSEIRIPILENTNLFKQTIGNYTDIIDKEMYSFKDLGGNLLSLRPEGTIGCARACIEHGLLYNQIQRLWYLGPMFRYERPQKGRYRQFYQFGVETFGLTGPEIDLELILISLRLWNKLKILDELELEINSIGSEKSRYQYQSDLKKFLYKNKLYLDKLSLMKIHTNPLRILDSKNTTTQEILKKAPILKNYLDSKSTIHFKKLCNFLDKLSVKYTVNYSLVRGLDYYNDTVFEWKSKHLGAKKTICAGGRYDQLTKMISSQSVPAMGFAIGMERLILLYKKIYSQKRELSLNPDILIFVSNLSKLELNMIEKIRNNFPNLKIKFEILLKMKFKKLNKFNLVTVILIFQKNNNIILKNCKSKKEIIISYKEILISLEKIFLI